MTGQFNFKRGLNSQSVGLLPLLLLMFLNNFYSSYYSFFIATIFGLGCVALFWWISKDQIYQFMLIPTIVTLQLYSFFLFIRVDSMLYVYSPLLAECLLVAVLVIINYLKRHIYRLKRKIKKKGIKYTQLSTALMEFFYIARILQSVYSIHLFIILFYLILPKSDQNASVEQFLFYKAPILLGILVILYEYIRLSLIKQKLQSEKWLPVLDKKGKVIGKMAHSVSVRLKDKPCHPIYRIAVIYDGMLFLTKSEANEIDPNQSIDHPFSGYVLFNQTFDHALENAWSQFSLKQMPKPRMAVRYLFENESISRLVSLYTVVLKTGEEYADFSKHLNGKLWMKTQMDENMGKGVFSEILEKEYSYLKSTILLAEECTERTQQEASMFVS